MRTRGGNPNLLDPGHDILSAASSYINMQPLLGAYSRLNTIHTVEMARLSCHDFHAFTSGSLPTGLIFHDISSWRTDYYYDILLYACFLSHA